MYNTLAELLALASQRRVPLWRIILEDEMALTGSTPEEIFQRLDQRYSVMCHSAQQAITGHLPQPSGLIAGIAGRQNDYSSTTGTICGSFINRLMARALSSSEVNASLGKICAAPTAGACGILPAVLISVGEQRHSDRRQILEALLTASGIGAIVTRNATVSGAEGGCQAECGVAAAMAAAAAVYLAGGSNEMAIDAICFVLMNVMGLVCDPVAGLVQVPCAQRNASQSVNAVLSADLALGGMVSPIPADEVIEAMSKVGKMMPMELRETALGGLAGTPTAKAIYRRIYQSGPEARPD